MYKKPRLVYKYGCDTIFDDESRKQMIKFLQVHDYDPETNTIEMDGERKYWGNTRKRSPDNFHEIINENAYEYEEEATINFLKKHNFDPQTNTYELCGERLVWHKSVPKSLQFNLK